MTNKGKALRHEWKNEATEAMFNWLTGQHYFAGKGPEGPEVWEHILSEMMASQDNWLYTFDESYQRFQEVVLDAWRKDRRDSGDAVDLLAEHLLGVSVWQVHTANLAIGLLKHSGHWHTYVRIMDLPAEQIENDPDAFVLATARERRNLNAYLAENEKEEQAEEALGAT